MKSELTRKEFLKSSMLAGLASALVVVTGCSEDDDGGSTGTGGSAGSGTGGSGGGTGGSGGGTGGSGGSGGGTGGSGATGGAAGSGGVDSCDAEVAQTVDHTHTLMVSADDVAAGVDKTYTTGTTNAHSHMVTITAAEFAMLAAGTPVTKDSSTAESHTHEVTVTCA